MLHSQKTKSFLFCTGVLFCLCLCLISKSYSQQISSAAVDLVNKGIEAQSVQKKIQLFEQALEIEPRYDKALYHLGRAYYQSGDYPDAIDRLNRVSAADTNYSNGLLLYLRNAYTFLAEKLLQENNIDAAYQNAQDALAIEKNYAPALTVLGSVYFAQQRFEDALSTLQVSVKINSNQETAWSKLGDVYLQNEAFGNAIDAYQKAITINPDLSETRTHLLIARNNNRPEYWLNKYEQTLKSENPDSGIKILQKAKANNPQSEEIRNTLKNALQERDYLIAQSAIANGEWDFAFKTLQNIDPDYKDTALKLEDVRAELILIQPDSLTDSSKHPEATSGYRTVESQNQVLTSNNADTAEYMDSKPRQTISVVNDSLLASQQSHIDHQPDTGGTPVDSTKLDSLIQANQYPEVTLQEDPQQTLPLFEKIRDVLSIPLAGLVAVAVFVLLAIIVMVIRKRPIPVPSRESLEETLKEKQPHTAPASHHSSLTHGTEELFQEKIASETPVSFNPAHRKRRYYKKRPSGKPDESQLKELSMLETKTMLGGIPKIKEIGRYVIEQEIGRGSMGQVYKALDPKLDRTVVIKQVAFDFSLNKEELEHLRNRLYREARAVASLSHPNIVIIYDVAEEKDFSYIVMEYVEGQDLQAYLKKENTLDIKTTFNILQQICRALDFAHKHNIIHRDIKPSNILITPQGKVKVADFGIAKLPHMGTITHTGNVMGTPFYMSPEQIEGQTLDGRSDIFSVGVMIYEMLTGVRPFMGESIPAVVYKIINKNPAAPSSVNKSLPAAIDSLIEQALAKDRENRYADARDLLKTLQEFKYNPA